MFICQESNSILEILSYHIKKEKHMALASNYLPIGRKDKTHTQVRFLKEVVEFKVEAIALNQGDQKAFIKSGSM